MMEARPHHLMKDFMDFLKEDVHEVLLFMILLLRLLLPVVFKTIFAICPLDLDEGSTN